MVTKKTRLLSAIAAILMLVSMLTGVVLPTSAEDVPSIMDYHNGTETDATKNYTVSSLAELEILNKYRNKITGTILLTEDIVFPEDYTAGSASGVSGLDARIMDAATFNLNGQNHTIEGLVIEGDNISWFGIYNGKKVENLTFKKGKLDPSLSGANYCSFLINTLPTGGVVNNVIFDGCTTTNENRASGNTKTRPNLLVGQGGKNGTISNITVKNCSINTSVGNAALIHGRPAVEGLTIKNILLVNNEYCGTGNLGSGLLSSEVSSGSVTYENIGIFNNKITADNKPGGLIVGAVLGAVTAKNILAYGNGDTRYDTLFCGHSSSGFKGTLTNNGGIYSDVQYLQYDVKNIAEDIALKDCPATAIDAAMVANQADIEQKWGLTSEGQLTFVGEGEKEVEKFTVEIRNPEDDSLVESYTDYNDVSGKLLNGEDYPEKAVLWTEDPAGVVANATVTGYVLPEHTHEWADYTSKGDGTHSYACECQWTVDGVGTITCDETGEAACIPDAYTNVSETDTEEADPSHKVIASCSLCGYQDPDAVATLCTGRLYEASNTAATSCKPEDAGAVVTKCTVCDYTHTKVIYGEDLHVYDKYVELEDQPNYHEIVCSVCDASSGELEKHTFGDWVETVKPTVDTEGEEQRTCKCQKVETRAKDKAIGMKVTSDEVKVGQTFDVAVELKNSTGIAALTLEVEYDPTKVILTGVEKGYWTNLILPGNIPTDVAATGKVTLNLLNPNNMYGDGTLVVLKFKAVDNVELYGETASIKVSMDNVTDYDLEEVLEEDETVEPVEAEPEILLVKGDMDNDGTVNMIDANLLLRYYNEKKNGESKATIGDSLITDAMADLCDDGDGEIVNDVATPDVNINDIIYLLRYLNGQIEL